MTPKAFWDDIAGRVEHVDTMLCFVKTKQGSYVLVTMPGVSKKDLNEAKKMISETIADGE